MAIDAVNDKQKKALMSLILVPVWESIKCQGDDCKAKESKKKKHGTVPASGQPQDLQIEHKYHGSKLLSLNHSDIVSHVALFVEMKTPFNCMIDKFATVETPVQTSTTAYATEEIIRLNLGKLMRTEESVKLGKEGAFNKKTLHMNLLKWDGNTNAKLMAGRNLKRLINKSEAGVRKLLAYQHSYQNSNKENRSGTAEEDLLAYILKKAWAASEFASLTKEDRILARKVTKDMTAAAPLAASAGAITATVTAAATTAAAAPLAASAGAITATATAAATTAAITAIANTTTTGDDSDSDLEDIVNEIEVIVEDILPPAEYVPDNDIVDEWIPDGWPTYIAYVCEFTRCTDAYLHMFTGDAYNLSRAGAKSRSATRKDKAKERTDARNIELGGGEVSGARGLSFDQRNTLANTMIKWSADNAMSLTAKCVTAKGRLDYLMNKKMAVLKQMEMYKGHSNLPGMQERVLKALDKLDAIDISLEEAEVAQKRALDAQTKFDEEDIAGQERDTFLMKHLTCGSGTRTAKKTKLQFSSPAASSVVSSLRSKLSPLPFDASDGDSD